MGGLPGKRLHIFANDPDETEGRKIYRDKSDALARAHLAYEKRGLRLKVERMDVGEE